MRKQMRLISTVALSAIVLAGGVSLTFSQSENDKRSEEQIRKALADWVAATNRRDETAANTIWAQSVVGWFPEAPEFSSRASFAVAGIPEDKGASYSTYELKIDEVAVSGSMAAVHDIWTETRHFNGSPVTVRRIIRGSELWRKQPDGKWRIVRWVSAPEKWEKVA
ncbi:MAG: nuclear transport factor 2 family protein [Pyrinomonadaceae bacterium]|nr:nuclear transport factor 2 family protein [Pyrinomonadaceae bacterium]